LWKILGVGKTMISIDFPGREVGFPHLHRTYLLLLDFKIRKGLFK
jgi:hypothetical protein